MIYIDEGILKITTDENEVALLKLMQELKLFKGEDPTNTDAGIDYLGVFNQTKFLKFEIQEVVDKHIDNFSSIEIGEVLQKEEVLSVPLFITLKNGQMRETLLQIMI